MNKFRFDRWGHRIHEDIKEIKLKIGKTYQFENWNKKEKGVKFTAEVIAEYKKILSFAVQKLSNHTA